MALEVTHIRFALSLAEKLRIANKAEYITGTLYPDSRYPTKTARELTHPEDFIAWQLSNLDDFKKGWFAHLLCDKIQIEVFKEKFPYIFKAPIIQDDPMWIELTAIKVIEDLNDLQKIDVSASLPNLSYARAINGEDQALLNNFYAAIIENYSSNLDVHNYGKKLAVLGLKPELADKVIQRTEQILQDSVATQKISAITDAVIERALQSSLKI